ncbi:uncharacterized protein ACIGJ3_001680 isoform 2-T2 [Trichechus inunguis]
MENHLSRSRSNLSGVRTRTKGTLPAGGDHVDKRIIYSFCVGAIYSITQLLLFYLPPGSFLPHVPEGVQLLYKCPRNRNDLLFGTYLPGVLLRLQMTSFGTCWLSGQRLEHCPKQRRTGMKSSRE